MKEPRGDYAKLVVRYFPELDAITRGEYHRLQPDRPAPFAPTRRPVIVCAACGAPFVPNRCAGRPRFCTTACRRWFHYGAGARDRKAVAA